MIDLSMAWSLIAVGFGVGTLVGLTGVGGGAIMTPLLIVVFGLPPSMAIGTDLINAAFMKTAGALQHWKQGTIEPRIVGGLALGSLPAAILGVGLVKFVKDAMGPDGESFLTTVLAWTLIFVAAMMIVRMIIARRQTAARRTFYLSEMQRFALTVLLGLICGILVSLTSVGAGSIVMIFLVLLYAVPAKCLVGTDILHAAALACVAATGHLWAGNVNLPVAGALLLGSLPGVLIGSRLSVRMPEVLLRVMLALTLMITGMRLIVH